MTTTSTLIKPCQKCGKELNGIPRLKDAKGKYWCPECGVGDTATTSSGVGALMSPCPKCKTPVHATSFVRQPKTGTYVCENCAAGVKVRGGSGGPAISDEAQSQKKKLIIACVLIGIGIGAYVVLNYFVL